MSQSFILAKASTIIEIIAMSFLVFFCDVCVVLRWVEYSIIHIVFFFTPCSLLFINTTSYNYNFNRIARGVDENCKTCYIINSIAACVLVVVIFTACVVCQCCRLLLLLYCTIYNIINNIINDAPTQQQYHQLLFIL